LLAIAVKALKGFTEGWFEAAGIQPFLQQWLGNIDIAAQ
jgi:hypothetical protein